MRVKHEGIGSNGPGEMSDPVHPKGEGLSFPPRSLDGTGQNLAIERRDRVNTQKYLEMMRSWN